MKKGKKYGRTLKRRAIMGIVGILVIIFVCFWWASDVNAESKADGRRYKYYTSVYISRDITLWDIAEENMTEEYSDIREYMEEVKTINHLSSDELQYGEVICVPYYSDEYK